VAVAMCALAAGEAEAARRGVAIRSSDIPLCDYIMLKL